MGDIFLKDTPEPHSVFSGSGIQIALVFHHFCFKCAICKQILALSCFAPQLAPLPSLYRVIRSQGQKKGKCCHLLDSRIPDLVGNLLHESILGRGGVAVCGRKRFSQYLGPVVLEQDTSSPFKLSILTFLKGAPSLCALHFAALKRKVQSGRICQYCLPQFLHDQKYILSSFA